MKTIDETIQSVLEKRDLAETERKRKKEAFKHGTIAALCVAVAFVFAGLYLGDVIFPGKAPGSESASGEPLPAPAAAAQVSEQTTAAPTEARPESTDPITETTFGEEASLPDSAESGDDGITPTGRSDGADEKTYVFYDGVLYVRDYSRFTGEEEDEADFRKYSEKHQMTFVGRIEAVEEKDLPSENFSALNAQVGDRLYTDEKGQLLLRRSDDLLVVLKRSEPKTIGETTSGTITESGISEAENSTETATVPVSESADNADISALFIDCAYFMVSRKHTIDKDDFVKNAEFIKVDFVAGDFRYYKIVFDGKTLGYISNIKNDSHFCFSYSDDAGNMLNSPFLCTVLSDGKVNPREDVTIG